jgi:hypothetical protein
MAGVKISGLPAVTAAALTDTYPVVQGGLTKVESLSQLQTLFNTNLSYLPLTGGTLTGPLILSGAPTLDLQAATKLYVDLTAQGLNPKPASNAATTAALTATYANGAAGIGATLTNAGALVALAVDSYTASVNDVILVKNQAASLQNGLYVVTAIGSGAVPWVLTRSTFMDAPTEFKGGFSFVISGAINAGKSFIEILAVTTVGTDPVTFTQQSGNFALSGANSDITSLSGLTGGISTPTGITLADAPGSSATILLNNTNSTGRIVIQAGTASATNGAALSLYGNSQVGRAGYFTVGLPSSLSTARFTINNQSLGAGADVFTISPTGLVTAAVPIPITSGGTGATTVNAAGTNLQTSGTFTPIISPSSGAYGSVTYTLQIGQYTRIGNVVFYSINLSISAFTLGTAAGNLLISGYPITPGGTTTDEGTAVIQSINFTGNLAAQMGGAGIILTKSVSGGSLTAIQAGDLVAGTILIRLAGTYFTT